MGSALRLRWGGVRKITFSAKGEGPSNQEGGGRGGRRERTQLTDSSEPPEPDETGRVPGRLLEEPGALRRQVPITGSGAPWRSRIASGGYSDRAGAGQPKRAMGALGWWLFRARVRGGGGVQRSSYPR